MDSNSSTILKDPNDLVTQIFGLVVAQSKNRDPTLNLPQAEKDAEIMRKLLKNKMGLPDNRVSILINPKKF